MLRSEITTERPCFGFVNDKRHSTLKFTKHLAKERADRDEHTKHLREFFSNNPIVTGWIRNQNSDSAIAHLRKRVDRFESNKHLRDTQNNLFFIDEVKDIINHAS